MSGQGGALPSVAWQTPRIAHGQARTTFDLVLVSTPRNAGVSAKVLPNKSMRIAVLLALSLASASELPRIRPDAASLLSNGKWWAQAGTTYLALQLWFYFQQIFWDIHGYSIASTAFVKLSWSSQLCRSATMLFTPHMLIVDLAQMLETTTTPMAWSWGRSHRSCSFYWFWGNLNIFEHVYWICIYIYVYIYVDCPANSNWCETLESAKESQPLRLAWCFERRAARKTCWRIWPCSHFPSSWGSTGSTWSIFLLKWWPQISACALDSLSSDVIRITIWPCDIAEGKDSLVTNLPQVAGRRDSLSSLVPFLDYLGKGVEFPGRLLRSFMRSLQFF